MSWYFIDGAGTTQGPVEDRVLTQKWNSKEINGETYVWNGTTVNVWSLLKDTLLLSQLNKAPAKPKPAPKKPKPAGGRNNLLDAIRSGRSLNKVTKKPEAAGNKAKPKPKGGKMSLQEQLAMRLKKSQGSAGPKKTTNKAKPKPKPIKKEPIKKAPKKVTPKKKSTASRGGAKVNKNQLKRMIDDCDEDWILQAIKKLLQ